MRRRRFLKSAVAATATFQNPLSWAAAVHDASVHAPGRTHFEPKAKRLLMIFLTGGFSHVDTFDYKPRLAVDAGKPLGSGVALASPFCFRRCGRSGLWMSELFPHLQQQADELAVFRTLHTDIVEHFQATLAMHTGSATVPMPSLGSWLSYGLGSFNPNLPAHLVFCEHLPYAGAQVWDHGFLPPMHQGVRVQPGERPIANLTPKPEPIALIDLERRMLADVNARHLSQRTDDLELVARMRSFDVARGMMAEAPEAFDLNLECEETLSQYGAKPGDRKSFAGQCLIARRLLERGVRAVEIIDTGASDNWDAHGDMKDHRSKARRVDRAIAGLIVDLKRRGLWGETLLAVCTEFGRTPWTEKTNTKGRNHHATAFTCLLAGAGIKGGTAIGETDEHGVAPVKDPVHVHDYHATILHLMGIDHEKLTYRYAGRDFRLTDVHGKVVHQALA